MVRDWRMGVVPPIRACDVTWRLNSFEGDGRRGSDTTHDKNRTLSLRLRTLCIHNHRRFCRGAHFCVENGFVGPPEANRDVPAELGLRG